MRTIVLSLAGGMTCSVALMVACGDDGSNNRPLILTPPAPTNSSSGSSGSSGSPGSSGSGDDGGQLDATTDTGTDGSSSFMCAAISRLDAGTGDASVADGGLVCPLGQWRDFSAASCRSCPATARPLTCADLFDNAAGSPSPTYSTTSRVVATTLKAGITQIVLGSASFDVGNCSAGAPMSNVQTVNVPVDIEGNVINASPSGIFGTTFKAPCGTATYTLVDACCTQSVVRVQFSVDYESGAVLARGCPDGG